MNQATIIRIGKLDPQIREYFIERVELLQAFCNFSRETAEEVAWLVTGADLLRWCGK